MVRAVIFDLDNCLAAADEVGRQLYEPVFAAIRRANHGAVSDDTLALAFDDCWRAPLDAVARKYGFTEEMLAAGWRVAKDIEIEVPMQGYSDLCDLAEFDAKLFLVTSGFQRLQSSKIRALGIAPQFARVYIDATDDPHHKGKEAIFREILDAYDFAPHEVLVVGDNPESEIEAGNNLGIPTVQILRPGVTRGTNANHFIHRLAELKSLLQ